MFCFFFKCYGALRDLHSFPTRRSSDLGVLQHVFDELRQSLRLLYDDGERPATLVGRAYPIEDRKSTRLNSSHVKISYAVFCLKKKKTSDADGRHARR